MSISNARDLQLLRVSHEELLLLLGVARLPIPLALGESPLDGYTDATLGPALASAGGSLMARGLLIPTDAHGRKQPEIAAGVEPLLADVALAESCLLSACVGEETSPVAYTTRADAVVRHIQPMERIHQLERLPNAAAIVAQLQQWITAPTPAGESLDFTLGTDTLMLAIDAIAANRGQHARSMLLMGNVSAAIADVFLERAGDRLSYHALLLFHQLQTANPIVDNRIVLKSHAEAWMVEKADATGDNTRVRTLDEEALHEWLRRLVGAMGRGARPLALEN